MGKAPTNQVYLRLPAGLSLTALQGLERRNRRAQALGVIHHGQGALFIVKEENHWRPYCILWRNILKHKHFQSPVFHKSVEWAGVKAFGA